MEIISVLNKSLKKIITELRKLNNHTKVAIKVGINIFLAFFSLGAVLILVNRTFYGIDSYIEFIAVSIIKASFTILAEIIIGCLLVDYIFN
ncbi:MAG: hypothetical protein GX754_00585 [Clostridiaceae bacterium]|nr:hypothetical protein [Clostridiaceae bacterium]